MILISSLHSGTYMG